jgi:hypothetical protein
LDEDALRSILRVLLSYGRRVEELTIACPEAYAADDVGTHLIEKRQKITDLLTQCFKALGHASGGQRLKALIVDVVRPRASTRQVSKNSPKSYEVGHLYWIRAVLEAIQSSQLSARAFRFMGCSIPINVFQHEFRLCDEDAIMQTVQDLKLTVSHSHYMEQEDAEINASLNKACVARISKFLKGAPNLESIDLHWYNNHDRHLRQIWPEYYELERLEFGDCLNSFAPPLLRKCSLRGLHISATRLCTFLSSTSAREITLQKVFIHERSWEEVFNILTRSEDPFQELVLIDLFDARSPSFGMILFRVPGKPKFRMLYPPAGPSELHRRGDEVPQPLGWTHGSRPVSCAGPDRFLIEGWRALQKAQFGPTRR